MSDFGAGAARLAGVAGRLFGWTAGQFWSATPAELAALIESDAQNGGRPPQRDEIEALIARFPDDEDR